MKCVGYTQVVWVAFIAGMFCFELLSAFKMEILRDVGPCHACDDFTVV